MTLESELAVTATLNDESLTSGTVVSEVGSYKLKITAVDTSGNEAEVEVEVEFEIVEGAAASTGSRLTPVPRAYHALA